MASDNASKNQSPLATCARCRCTESVVILTPDLQHHGKRVCKGCRRFLEWVPRPNSGVIPDVRRAADAPLATLRGASAKQVEAAASIRFDMLWRARAEGLDHVVAVISATRDATWFLANRNCTLGDLRWPAEHQMDNAPRST
jgi:hypothetical protein